MSVSRFPRRSLDSYLVVVAGSRHDVVLVRTNVSPATHAARGGVPFVRDDARSENPVGTTREAADRRARATQGGEARRWMSRGRTWFSGSWFSWYTCRWWSSPMVPAARGPEQRAAGRVLLRGAAQKESGCFLFHVFHYSEKTTSAYMLFEI